ncbi:MetQ/NlpA family ABC transporter substrate-binding protein [Lentilactobacillus hilgardii]|uniref:ABC transporter substrate-binding protein n=1 Tax=Lentilactobacillus hilgardii TaxID=1588 RepID=A0A6P1EBG7_LENHI|nr:MetQ/NlpA family ABC transporter substrate-binding protein [Lentilactobacillus hilgardii]EEI71677.1 NLPA lipoprotein [Lentilactobacillus hilgardii ATCC 27305]MCT3392892.1 ABC transporter substrate-binding protein [Lentilactobacillus hilgardii]QHB51454.1 ABC transporter substrate-binding protein [Lentilactobacillus hilgardii]RRG08890.1 MAG: ABC transporter substrate-binding protein [Lactobacillus sp.]
MKKGNRFIKVVLLLALLISIPAFLSACGNKNASGKQVVKVGVVGTSDAPIWKQVNQNLKKQGSKVRVKLVSFTDGVPANQAQANKDIDLTAFQHYAFLHQEEKEKHYKFKVVGQTYLVPLNVFSSKIKSLSQIKNGDKIAIPNNVTNAGRALKVLETAGLIKLDPSKGNTPAIQDITQNKHHLKIIQVDPSKIMNLLPDFTAGITNSNFVLAAKKDPIKDAIYRVSPKYSDPKNKPWINVIVARKDEANKAAYKQIVKAYHTASVAKELEKLYSGVYTPAFKY